jgi:hypothetical protein
VRGNGNFILVGSDGALHLRAVPSKIKPRRPLESRAYEISGGEAEIRKLDWPNSGCLFSATRTPDNLGNKPAVTAAITPCPVDVSTQLWLGRLPSPSCTDGMLGFVTSVTLLGDQRTTILWGGG